MTIRNRYVILNVIKYKKEAIIMRKVVGIMLCGVLGISSIPVSANEVIPVNNTPVEIISERSEYGKHYDNGDGTFTAFVNTAPIHYYDNGQWNDIDNTLEKNEDGDYVNRSNSLNVKLSSETSLKKSIDKNTDEQTVEIEYNGYSLSWDLMNLESQSVQMQNNKFVNSSNEEQLSEISIEDNHEGNKLKIAQSDNEISDQTAEIIDNLNSKASYESISDNIDLDIELTPTSVKDTIVLNEPCITPQEYTYYIKSEGLYATLNDDGSLDFTDNKGNSVFFISPAMMYDSSENTEYSYDIETKLSEYEEGYLLTLIPDNDWINSEERVYPIMIDPEVTLDSEITGVYVDQKSPDKTFKTSFLKMGGDIYDNNRKEIFLSFPYDFSNFSKMMDVISAECNMYVIDIANKHDDDLNYLCRSVITSECDMNNITYNNMAKLPIDSYFSDSIGNINTSTYYKIDITGIAQTWLNYAQTKVVGIKNNGINLSINPGSHDDEVITMLSPKSSTNKPYYTMKYTLRDKYKLNYAPGKYNDTTDIANFQKRMNCYAYALQVYYNGDIQDGDHYALCPGEFGIKYNANASDYTQLCDLYRQFKSNSEAYMDFVESRMMEDAQALNFSISKMKVINQNVLIDIPSDYNEKNERIIAMVTGISNSGILDYHYYARNGNGTCPNGHGGNCSMWSHKRANTPISNRSIDGDALLCDENINSYAKEGIYSSTPEVRYYRITKDVYLYNSWHGDGRNGAGTPYRN